MRENNLHVYNTLSRSKERFEPLAPPRVGMYVCGPTVYGDAHLGHAKSYVSFDVILRYLRYLGYQVTYVQNITDVGHLTDNADAGEDKVEQKARAERVHPMAIAESYTRRYFEDMDALGVLRPDISPRASGHIVEQIEHVKRLLEKGHAYEVGGNVYFDVASWPKYGRLSGRTVGEMQAGARVEVSAEKRHPADFALWKRAEPGHIMQWPSPWGMGYPGWHLECSAMSQKYLGETFDIHGGGLENQFPHHEDEIAQAEAATGKPFVRYWLHNNMVTVGGQKMGKSLGNFITLKDAFQKWDPMVIRMFILQSHYRSPLDFSDEAVKAAGDGYKRLSHAVDETNKSLATASEEPTDPKAAEVVADARHRFAEAMDDDFNAPVARSVLFDLAREANSVSAAGASRGTLELFSAAFRELGGNVLGIRYSGMWAGKGPGRMALIASVLKDKPPLMVLLEHLLKTFMERRERARHEKKYNDADVLRAALAEGGVILKDTPGGPTPEIDREVLRKALAAPQAIQAVGPDVVAKALADLDATQT